MSLTTDTGRVSTATPHHSDDLLRVMAPKIVNAGRTVALRFASSLGLENRPAVLTDSSSCSVARSSENRGGASVFSMDHTLLLDGFGLCFDRLTIASRGWDRSRGLGGFGGQHHWSLTDTYPALANAAASDPSFRYVLDLTIKRTEISQ